MSEKKLSKQKIEKRAAEAKRLAEFLKDCVPQTAPGLNRDLPPERVPAGTLKGFTTGYDKGRDKDGRPIGRRTFHADVSWKYE